jgi:ADP-ribosylglycohydrolase
MGESGVGKSRLAEKGMRAAEELGMVVLQAQCVDQQAEPLKPLREALKRYRGETPVRDLLLAADPALVDYVPFLESFLQVGTFANGGSPLGGTAAGGVNDGLVEIVLGLGRAAGLCLVVEDLTDADHDTLSFLEYLDRKRGASRVLTITTVKSDLIAAELAQRIQGWQLDGCAVCEIGPFTREDAAAFINLIRKGQATENAWIDDIFAQTGGNPFFIEQFVSLATESQHDGGMAVPDRVEAVLNRRLDLVAGVDNDLRLFLDAAAVGLEVTQRLDVVADVGQMTVDQAALLLVDAVAKRFLTEAVNGEIAFAQNLLQRVIRDDLPPENRQAMNLRAAQLLEKEKLFASASHHYEAALRPDDMVRTALLGAQAAEHAGTYAAAAQLYSRARAHGDRDAIGVDLARVDLILGAWGEVDTVLASLPTDQGPARVVRSDLYFVRGAYDRSLRELRLASQSPSVDPVKALIRLADINLYLGRLVEANRLATRALEHATDHTIRAKCFAVIGTTLYHLGDVERAQEAYLKEIHALPERVEERDRLVYTVALHNLGLAREIRGDWAGAKRFHAEALRLRMDVSAAREVGHSRHSLIRCAIGEGDFETALAMLKEARDAAEALDEELELGKLDHTDARIRLLTNGDPMDAVRLIEGALERFRRMSVSYDIAHATFALSTAYAASGAERRAVEEAASGRTQMERGEFRLLSRLFADLGYSYRDRVYAGLVGYAAGDAVGLPWEGKPAADVDAEALSTLRATKKWPAGATSDDTALTLMVGEHLAAGREADGVGFLKRLAKEAGTIPGLGPSTTAAIKSFKRTHKPPTTGGNTNGALMRSLPIGWALGIDRVEDRRAWVAELSEATHPGAEAVTAASIGAACAAWAIEDAPPALLLAIACEEATAVVASRGSDGRIIDLLAAIRDGSWEPDPAADELDPYETVARVLACVVRAPTVSEAVLLAVRMGGDTDTVAALVGGILGCRQTPATLRSGIAWIDQVNLPANERINAIAQGLAELRVVRTGG